MLQQSRTIGGRQANCKAQRTRILRGGFAVRAQRGRVRSGRGRELEYRLPVVGGFRVVREA